MHNQTTVDHWELFYQQLRRCLPAERIVSDLSRRLAVSGDASFYHKLPKLAVYIASREEMQQLLRLANGYAISLTFRAAGTSLSGQAITDSVLVMLTRDWQALTILDNGRKVNVQPGVIGAEVNRQLAPYGYKIGPDPASINSCHIGGIAANNASGMCCGVQHNSYHTMAALSFILADGSHIDTADAASVTAFRTSHAELLQQLQQLAETVKADPIFSAKIRQQYRFKNTMGYGLNALLDYSDPVAILSHLFIGSEGTLGFIDNITYQTVAIDQARATGLLLFPTSTAACQLIPLLKSLQVAAVELFDDRALRAVARMLEPYHQQPFTAGMTALLIEIGRPDEHALQQAINSIEQQLLSACPSLTVMAPFTSDNSVCNDLWRIRKGLFPAVGAVRASGTTVIIEDVAFDIDVLDQALLDLQQLLKHYGYDEAIIFGHALDGNLHFVFTQSFNEAADVARYRQFMDALQQLVIERYKGTLKAEHGTGRNMAPYLYAQWGGEGLRVMQRLKQLIDPQQILNPGVILNDADDAHIRDLKQLPSIDPIVDSCIECGFCEPHCPSLNYTLSPRQRIALRRRQQQLQPAEQEQVEHAFQHLGIDSCAATGLCQTSCPVGINTGEWIQQLRAQQPPAPPLARWTAAHLGSSIAIARFALAGLGPLQRLFNSATKPAIPAPAPKPPSNANEQFHEQVVYWAGCANRLFASSAELSLPAAVQQLCQRAGIGVRMLTNQAEHCCGQPWLSKGHPDIAAERRHASYQQLWQLTEQGRWPVLVDASACALQLDDLAGIKVFELSQFLEQQVVDRLTIKPLQEPLLLHVTCSSRHLDQGQALRTLAHQCSNQVVEPSGIYCCGFAGDKGFTEPQLNAAALAPLAAQVPADCRYAVSNNRSCEIGLSHHSGVNYQHIALLLEQLSR